MISGNDILSDVMDGGYFSIEEEPTICSLIYIEGIKSISSAKKERSNVSKLTGRLESLDVYSLFPLGEVGHLWILCSYFVEILINSSPDSLPGSGVIGASIYGRLSLGGPVTRTYILSWPQNGLLPWAISWYGGRGTMQISLHQALISEPYVQLPKSNPT
jgi:hypothetical protein